jgi:hypothetical protein
VFLQVYPRPAPWNSKTRARRAVEGECSEVEGATLRSVRRTRPARAAIPFYITENVIHIIIVIIENSCKCSAR